MYKQFLSLYPAVTILALKFVFTENLSTERNPGDLHTTNVNGSREQVENSVYDRIIKDGAYIPGDICELPESTKEIPWVNPELLQKGREFVDKNFFALILAKTVGLLYGFPVKSATAVLLRAGNFESEDVSFRRMMSTFARIHSWHDDDLMSNNSLAIRNIKLVRGMHAHAAEMKNVILPTEGLHMTAGRRALCKAIRADLDHVNTSEAPHHLLNWTPQLAISQFDMAVTQFLHFGLLDIMPKTLCIYDMDGFEGYVHHWAVIGRLLGMEDKFNLGLHYDREIFRKIFMNIIVTSLKTSDETVVFLQDTMMNGIGNTFTMSSTKALLYLGLREAVPGFEGNNIHALMTFKDRMEQTMLTVISRIVAPFPLLRDFANYALKYNLMATNPWAFPPGTFKNVPYLDI